MRLISATFTFLLMGMLGKLWAQMPQKPFPNHTHYTGEFIQPEQFTQEELDQHVSAFYEDWRDTYLRNDCNEQEYYIKYRSDANTVSEAHGYGMMIMVYLAGYDEKAKRYFDGLYHYFKAHPSQNDPYLMDWQQITCDDPISASDGTATDGDLDIAFSLLLAHHQWGSQGEINYLGEARHMLTAILKHEINPALNTVLLGDWSTSDNSKYYNSTRTSDFLTGHFRAFVCYSNEKVWTQVLNTCLSIITELQSNHSQTTGLLPDFVSRIDQSPQPAHSDFLEGAYDGHYYYNACRTPWRLGTDYLVSGDDRSKQAVLKMNKWLMAQTGGHVEAISNGYLLGGTPIYNWHDATFAAPFAVGAMLGENQSWLNDLYADVLNNNKITRGDYYSHTIKLLSLLTISGNYWAPDCDIKVLGHINTPNFNFTVYPNPFRKSLFVNWNGQDRIKTTQVIISEINGKRVKSFLISPSTEYLETADLKSGMYLLTIVSSTSPPKVYKIRKVHY